MSCYICDDKVFIEIAIHAAAIYGRTDEINTIANALLASNVEALRELYDGRHIDGKELDNPLTSSGTSIATITEVIAMVDEFVYQMLDSSDFKETRTILGIDFNELRFKLVAFNNGSDPRNEYKAFPIYK